MILSIPLKIFKILTGSNSERKYERNFLPCCASNNVNTVKEGIAGSRDDTAIIQRNLLKEMYWHK